jgi:hypothetical protein
MLASINPLVERSRNSRFAVTFIVYVVASTAGGAVLGSALGLAGAALHEAVSWSNVATAVAVAVVGVVALAFDLRAGGLVLPSIRRQVNEDLLADYRGWVYGSVFGFQLGLGVVTIVTTATVYATFALAFLAHSWRAGLLIGAVFGVVRAMPMLLVVHVRDPAQLRETIRRVHGWAAPAQRIATAALVVAATVGAFAAVS